MDIDFLRLFNVFKEDDQEIYRFRVGPKVFVKESDDEITLTLNLPGYSRDKIYVTAISYELFVSVEDNAEHRFERKLDIPFWKKMTAVFEADVLIITLVKAVEEHHKKLQIV